MSLRYCYMEKTRLRWIWTLVLVLLFCGAGREVYGQRVYASKDVINAEYSGLGGLLGRSGVRNHNNAIDQSNLNNYSELILVALLGGEARQSLRFEGTVSPKNPVIVKFTAPGSILDLITGFSIQRTIGGEGELTTVGNAIMSNQLLRLLNLGSNTYEIQIPVSDTNTQGFDGIQVRISGLLNVSAPTHIYYAFYITPPQLSSQKVTLCEGEPSSVVISNFDANRTPGYTYRLYDAETGGTSLSQTTLGTVAISEVMQGVFWLEAREGDLYPSARTKIEIVRNKISNNTISGNQSICQEDTPSLINGVIPTVVGATIAYQWQRKTTGEYVDVLGGISQNFQPSRLYESTKFRRAVSATLNGVSCVSYSNEITVTIKPKPPAPNIEIHPNSQY